MLGNVELCGKDRSIIRCFLLEKFRAAMPIGLIQEMLKGGAENGQIIKLLSISFLMNWLTISGLPVADCKLGQKRL